MTHNSNLYTLFEQRCPTDPSALFLKGPNTKNISYSMLHRSSAQFAQVLQDLGIKRGDRVLVLTEKVPQSVALYLACLRSGFIYVPLNSSYRDRELSYFINDAQPSAVICGGDRESTIKNLSPPLHILTLDPDDRGSLLEISQCYSGNGETVISQADDIAVILYTSGTTGHAKGAMLSHRNLTSNALVLDQAWGWKQSDVLLHILPVFHAHGLFVAIHGVLTSGSSIIYLNKPDINEIIQYLPHCSLMMAVPTHYRRLLKSPELNQVLCQSVRLFISGSAALSPDIFEQFRQRTGQTILERYGMTETVMNTSNPLHGERRPGSIGQPLSGIDVRLTDTQHQPVTDGATGMLEIKGDNVFLGYWNKPKQTSRSFTDDGYFITGDLGCRDDSGYITLVGRHSDLIISGGFNIYPTEVERCLEAIEGIIEAAVFGLADTDYGECVVAVLVGDQNIPITQHDVLSLLTQQLVSYKIPKQLFWLDKLPRNVMDKVQKTKLKDQYTLQNITT